jgi:hypothetical protein
MKVSDQVRSKFVKDFNLPIPITTEPHFSYYIELYEPLFQSKTKFEKFLNSLQEVGSEQEFISKSKSFSTDVINKISESKAFKEFNEGDASNYKVKDAVGQKNVYSTENLNQYLISIDMSSANFNALKYHNPEIVI